MNIYLITNIISWIMIAIIFLIAFAMERFTFKKISLRHMTVIAMFGAISVVLTNVISYSIPIFGNVRLALGDWIIFLIGMLFGPMSGVISAITIDSIGMLAPNPFSYHAGFLLNKVILGLFGSFVFLFKTKKYLFFKVIILYFIPFALQSLVLNPVWMMSWIGNAAWVDLIFRVIKLPISITIYVSLAYTSFKVLYPLLKRWPEENIWCLQNEINYTVH